jgi:uncharacterized membrane protein (DUF441 family)
VVALLDQLEVTPVDAAGIAHQDFVDGVTIKQLLNVVHGLIVAHVGRHAVRYSGNRQYISLPAVTTPPISTPFARWAGGT